MLWANSTSEPRCPQHRPIGRVWVIQESDRLDLDDARTEWMKLMSKVVVFVGEVGDKVFATYSAIFICVSLGGLWDESQPQRKHMSEAWVTLHQNTDGLSSRNPFSAH
jgi:hypothetical protein